MPTQIKKTFLNYATVEWLTHLLWKGSKSPLVDNDMMNLPLSNQSLNISASMDVFWVEYEAFKNGLGPKPSLMKHMTKIFGRDLGLAIFLNLISAACILAIPVVLEQLIIVVGAGNEFQTALTLALLLFGLQIGVGLFQQLSLQLNYDLQVNIRTVLTSSLFAKSMRLSPQSSKDFSQGKILNLINVDTESLTEFLFVLPQLVSAPFQLVVSIVLISNLLGPPMWGGVGAMLLALGLMILSLPFLIRVQTAFFKIGDKRLQTIREMLYGIKIIKFRALESYFFGVIDNIRKTQLKAMKRYYIVMVYYVGMIQLSPVAMPVIAFMIYGAVNGSVKAEVVFPALAVFNVLGDVTIALPDGLGAIAVARVSWNRVASFLVCEESSGLQIEKDTKENPKGSLQFENATFGWLAVENTDDNYPEAPEPKSEKETDEAKISLSTFDLKGLELNIKPCFKVGIVGPVGILEINLGAGKSSLLSAVIDEMPMKSGSKHIYGSIAYCPQQPWILSNTIQDNILFGKEFDSDRFQRVLAACNLDKDLKSMSSGAQTEIGEKGVILSGGQKARVALARAMYQDADIYLLDDPISALDAHVGKHVFEHAIKNFLAEKTVLLVTHQLHLLPHLDYCIVLDQGMVGEQGTFEELMNSGGLLTKLMESHTIESNDEQAATVVAHKVNEEDGGDKFQVDEDQEQGAVGFSLYIDYIHACGGWTYGVALIGTTILYTGAEMSTNFWLSIWSEDKLGLNHGSYLLGYGLIGLGQGVLAIAQLASCAIGNYFAAKQFHQTALKNLLNAPVSFFETQPIGRILNRFSRDIKTVDFVLWMTVMITLITLSLATSALSLMIYSQPLMTLVIVPLLISYFYLFSFFQRSNREFKRFESTRSSPLYAHVSETMAGLSTVKAFGFEQAFIAKQHRLMDYSNEPKYLRLMASIWIRIRLQFLSTFLTLAITLFGVYALISPSLLGLATTYSVGFTTLINYMLLNLAQLETEFNAIERLAVYSSKLPSEAAKVTESDPLLGEWPINGSIAFENVTLVYPTRPTVPVLKQLSIDIKPGEKVGIIGRTGSGKSSSIIALFRLVELQGGRIVIDGVDISTIGLGTLRSRLEIIPQEAVLFSGTIRSNLDIKNEYEDSRVWEALEYIGLKDFVTNLQEKLDYPVSENGENLSVGQRQLICLGRAILTKPKILVMDEATASVDTEADKLIQESIKTHFKETTVLSIAHRLNTIADFDRVLVLQDGLAMEFASPHELLSDPESLFSRLADATGPANAEAIRKKAAGNQTN
jgi:ABC-type multidrug transport system fused ATPase/permease subunit